MNKKYTLSEQDVKILAEVVQKSQTSQARPPLPREDRQVQKASPSYWALPPCETGLPAAEYTGDVLTPKGVYCCLFRHDTVSGKMEQMLDALGMPVRQAVYNYYTEPINELVQVTQHKDGHWACERGKSLPTTAAPSVTTAAPTAAEPSCQGECLWVADSSGVWQWPIGGCANTSTTTTTAGPTTTPAPTTAGPTTTPAPCESIPCRLRCVDTGTTPAPVDYGVIVPYTRFRYEVIAGNGCDSPCRCYGEGDPCFLEDGELTSQCLKFATTTSTTTLPPSTLEPCFAAEIFYGPDDPESYRAAANPGKPDSWETCRQCQSFEFPLYPKGGDVYRNLGDFADRVVVYETPCLVNPCGTANELDLEPDAAYFKAYRYSDQINLWGEVPGITVKDNENGRYLGNFVLCQDCPAGQRPIYAPPLWLFDDDSININSGVELLPEGVWRFKSYCTKGQPCDACVRAPFVGFRKDDPLLSSVTTSTTSTTTTTTTTQSPCGCPRPGWCPAPFECAQLTCSVGGEIRGGVAPGSTPAPRPLPCFPDSTTTGGPTTTPAPGNCIDTYGTLCTCSTTTATPCDSSDFPIGRCCPGFVFVPAAETENCTSGGTCVPLPTTTTGRPPTPGTCAGGCKWKAVKVWDDYNTATEQWQLMSNNCDVIGGSVGNNAGVSCGCPIPAAPAEGRCGDEAYTGCIENPAYTTTTLPPCACCSTTNNPCARICRYGQINGRWTLVSNPCSNPNCTCQPASGIGITPETPCQQLTIGCGSTFPPTTGTPTTLPPTTRPACPECSAYPTIPPGGNACMYASNADNSGWRNCGCNCNAGFNAPPLPTGRPEGCIAIAITCVPTTAAPTSTTSTTPAPTGRCCYGPIGQPKICGVGPQDICDYVRSQPGYEGTWTLGANCSGANPCNNPTTTTSTTTPVPTGACCFPAGGPGGGTGGCIDGVTAAACAAGLGTYYGNGTTCAGSPGLCTEGA